MNRSRHVPLLALALVCCTGVPPRPPPPLGNQTASASAAAQPRTPAQAFAAAAPEFGFPDPDRRKKLESAFPEIDRIGEAELQRQSYPSLVVGVVIDGDLAYSNGFGMTDLDKKQKPNADTIYRIGSITKSFTGLAVLALRDDGALSLDDPLSRFVPEAAGIVYPVRDAPPITLRHLLTHRSGLPNPGPFLDIAAKGHVRTEDEITKTLSGFALETVPGTRYEYSNLGFALLGIAAERAAHVPYHDIVRSRILAPLQMTSTFWDFADVPKDRLATPYSRLPSQLGVPGPIDPVGLAMANARLGASDPAAGLYSSVRDMARYVAFQLAAYPPSNAPERYPIRRSTLREAHTTGLDSGLRIRFDGAAQKGDSLIEVNAERYGFGWVAQQTCEFEEIVGHHGALGGYAGTIMFLPKRGVGVIVLTNLWRSEPEDVATRVLRALARTGGLVARSPKLSPAFEAAMKRYISLQNKWDEALYAEMIGREKLPEEKGELASYKDRHGTCKGYSLLEVMEPRRARFKLDCERGVLELELLLDDNGKVLAFSGTSRDAPVPAPLRKVGDRIAGLIGKWDERVYKKHLASTRMSHDDTIRSFAALRAQHGTCSVKSAIHTFAEPRLVLACDRGGEVLLTVKVDATNPDAVAAYAFESAVNGLCPVR